MPPMLLAARPKVTNPDIGKSQVFKFSMMKKHWGVIPLVVILGGTVTGVAITASYFLLSKPNLRLNRRADFYPYEYVGPTDVRRFWKSPFFGKIEPIPEVEQLRKEIGYRKYPKGEH